MNKCSNLLFNVLSVRALIYEYIKLLFVGKCSTLTDFDKINSGDKCIAKTSYFLLSF